jgi:hypothetical protein
MEHNQLVSIPSDISNLRNLRELNLFANRLRVLPLELLSIKHLARLDVQCNSISKIPFTAADFENTDINFVFDSPEMLPPVEPEAVSPSQEKKRPKKSTSRMVVHSLIIVSLCLAIVASPAAKKRGRDVQTPTKSPKHSVAANSSANAIEIDEGMESTPKKAKKEKSTPTKKTPESKPRKTPKK